MVAGITWNLGRISLKRLAIHELAAKIRRPDTIWKLQALTTRLRVDFQATGENHFTRRRRDGQNVNQFGRIQVAMPDFKPVLADDLNAEITGHLHVIALEDRSVEPRAGDVREISVNKRHFM